MAVWSVGWQSTLRRADTVSAGIRTFTDFYGLLRTMVTWCSECHVLLYFYSAWLPESQVPPTSVPLRPPPYPSVLIRTGVALTLWLERAQARQPTTWQRPAAAALRAAGLSITHGRKGGGGTRGKVRFPPCSMCSAFTKCNAHSHWLAVCIAQSRYCEQCRYGWVRKSTDKYGLGHREQ